MVVELSALIQIYADVPVNTFFDFFKLLYKNIINLARGYEHWDIVCDRYLKDRGSGSQKTFTDLTKFPRNFREDYLGNGENKEDLNHHLAIKFIEFHKESDVKLVVTKGDSILTNHDILHSNSRISAHLKRQMLV